MAYLDVLNEKMIAEKDLALIHLTDSPQDAVNFIVSTCQAPNDLGPSPAWRKMSS